MVLALLPLRGERTAAAPPGRVEGPRPVRQLVVASVLFALAVAFVVWLISTLILHDLSESYLMGVITQAKDETESFVRVLAETETEGEVLGGVKGQPEGAIDPPIILDDRSPLPEEGGDEILPPVPQAAPGVELTPAVPPGPPGRPASGVVPATLSTHGTQKHTFLNGELIRRDAIQWISIDYPGGRRRHVINTIDQRDYDESVVESGRFTTQSIYYHQRPSSRQIKIGWNSFMDGEPVHLEAFVDPAVLDEGLVELRGHVVPKLAAGGVVFVLMLVLAFLHLLRLMERSRRLQAAASERARLAEVGLLAAGLAHEIRNPLSAMRMNLQLLEEDLHERAPRGADEPAGTLLRPVQRELDRVRSLLTDFLTYARPLPPRKESRRIDAVVKECVDLLRPTAASAGVELSLEVGVGEKQGAVDEAMIKQALTNIVANAIEAVPKPGGRVHVATQCLRTGCRISVQDDGPGLPEDPESLFDAFHTTKVDGFGLGLAISRSLVERHGGRLTARTLEQGGAEFAIELPSGDGGPEE